MIASVSALASNKLSISVFEYTSAGTPTLTFWIASYTALALGISSSTLVELNVVTTLVVSTLAVNKSSTSVLLYTELVKA